MTTVDFVTPTGIPDLVVITPKIFSDERGYFYESYNKKTLEQIGIYSEFVQDNQAKSSYGVLRGLHYQMPPFAQAKLVRVIAGEVLDVAVDLRPKSPTFGKVFTILLSADNKKQLFVPRGFAHGYVCLSETAEFAYKCDNFYAKNCERGIIFDDAHLAIDWQIDLSAAIVSDKDQILPNFAQAMSDFEAFADYKLST